MENVPKKFKILKIVQIIVFAIAWIIMLIGFINMLKEPDEESKAVALIFFLVIFWGVFGGVGSAIGVVLGLLGLILAIKEKRATQNVDMKKQIIYFAVSSATILILYFCVYFACVFIV